MNSTAASNADRLKSERSAIVVLTYNHPEISMRCIDSVLNLNPTSELFIVHNGSTAQNTQLLTQKYANAYHILLKENLGYSGGANAGLKMAFTKFEKVLFLTNDTELLSLPESAPSGFCSVTIRKRNTEHIDSISGLINFKSGRLQHVKDEKEIFYHKDKYKNKYIPGTAFWMDRKTYEELQGFDESFHTYWEDVDLSYRAHLKNLSLSYSKETVVKHKIGKTCHKNDFYTYYLFQRNRKKFMRKHQLDTSSFWLRFSYDIIKNCKYRFRDLWRIIYD